MNVLLVSYTIYFKGRLFDRFDLNASGVPPGTESNDKKIIVLSTSYMKLKYIVYETEFVWTPRPTV